MRLELGPSLAELRRQVLNQIDRDAEVARLRFITPGAGQALTYESKRAEALRIATDPTPTEAHYPFLAVEIGITAATLVDVGALVRARADAWALAGAQIERLRLGAKARVMAATTPVQIREAGQISWPTPNGA